MAEFTVVIAQQKRMCEATRHCCDCPLHSMDYDCRFMAMIDADYDAGEVEAIERIVMGWAEKNPEPRYPSWNEAWRRLWPNAIRIYSPCPGYFLEEIPCNGVANDRMCDKCRNRPIPADIAEKLGIKPIENKGGTGK